MPLHITHLSGAGNNFLLIDAMHGTQAAAQLPSSSQLPQLARRLCHNYKAEGMVVLVAPPTPTKHTQLSKMAGAAKKQPVLWRFYNPDGRAASMCGNAARCIAHYICRLRGSTECLLQRPNILNLSPPFMQAHKSSRGYKVQMPAVTQQNWQQELEKIPLNCLPKVQASAKSSFTLIYDFLNTGVPHVVLNMHYLTRSLHPYYHRLAGQELERPIEAKHWWRYHKLAQFIQQHPRFMPNGTNVSFYFVQSDNNLQAVTFERGLLPDHPPFTQACGTGAIACAAGYNHHTKNTAPVHVLMPGGPLWVDWQNNKMPYLEGPVTEIGRYHG